MLLLPLLLLLLLIMNPDALDELRISRKTPRKQEWTVRLFSLRVLVPRLLRVTTASAPALIPSRKTIIQGHLVSQVIPVLRFSRVILSMCCPCLLHNVTRLS